MRAAKIVASVAVLGLGAFALRNIGLRQLAAQMSALSPSTIVLVLIVSIAQLLALATRLWFVFPRGSRPGWPRVARAFGFGQFANACLPARTGDVLKVVTLARDPSSEDRGEKTTAAGATGAMLADKALDTITLLGLVAAFAPALLLGIVAAVTHAAWVGVAAAGALVASWVAAKRLCPALVVKVARYASALRHAVRSLATPERLAGGLALGVAAWLAEAFSMLLLSWGLGIHLSLGHAVIGLLVLNLGIALPLSVANLGVYEAATVVGLAPFGVSTPQALALGALHHAAQLLALAMFALVFWARDRALPKALMARFARRATQPRLLAPLDASPVLDLD